MKPPAVMTKQNCESSPMEERKHRGSSAVLSVLLLTLTVVHVALFVSACVYFNHRVEIVESTLSLVQKDTEVTNMKVDLVFEGNTPLTTQWEEMRRRLGGSWEHNSELWDHNRGNSVEHAGHHSVGKRHATGPSDNLESNIKQKVRREIGEILKQLSDATFDLEEEVVRQDMRKRIDTWVRSLPAEADDKQKKRQVAGQELGNIFTELAHKEEQIFAKYCVNNSILCLPGAKGDVGQKGAQGIIGAPGIPGLNGTNGAKGQQGDTGAKGELGQKGDTGATGPQGIQGRIGDKGDVGAKGEVGQQGPVGLKGDQGPAGHDGAKGEVGPQGPMGLSGPPGPKGSDGYPGVPGRKGEVGDKGEVGAKGELGQQGPIGVKGDQGAVGHDGAKGEVGPQGPMGLSGPPGPKGSDGYPGVPGRKGEVGDKGEVGTKGDQGQQGPIGLKGDQGATGRDGAKGEVGPQGPMGLSGPPGPKGSDGYPGVPGRKGEVGDKGEVGSTGPQGHQGYAGLKGEPGNAGVDGRTGPKGDQGLAGISGPPGPKGEMGYSGPPGRIGPKGEPGNAVAGVYDTCCTQLTKPKFTEPTTVTVTKEGDNLTLVCGDVSYPPATITWQANGLLAHDPRYFVDQQQHLIITGASLLDDGSINCTATNALGSGGKTFVIRVPQHLVIAETARNITTVEGSKMTLQCSFDNIPPPTITWYHVMPDGTRQKVTAGVTQLPDGTSTLTRDPVEVPDRGQYVCVGDNGVETAQLVDNVVVESVPYITTAYASGVVVGNAGDNLVLRCLSDSVPTPVVHWTHDRNDSHVFEDANGFLHILDLRPADAGNYTCLATNKHGQSYDSIQVVVRVPPQATMAPNLGPLQLNAFFDCLATGDEPLTLTWRKDGQPLDMTSSHYLALPSTDSHHRLLVTSTTDADVGTYTCVVTNAQGTVTDDTIIYKDIGTVTCATSFVSCTTRLCGAHCPQNCATDTSALVYGNNTYSEDSSICRSSIHAGVLSQNQAGTVVWENENNNSPFQGGVLRNGVTSTGAANTPHSAHPITVDGGHP